MRKVDDDGAYIYDEEPKNKRKKGFLIFILILLFLISAVGVVYLVWNWYNLNKSNNFYSEVVSSYTNENIAQEAQSHDSNPENPVDFESLQKRNSDVYAWIVVPNTKINYPIVQNEQTDFYLRRSLDKEYLFAGCIYTNKVNSKDFSDPVTVVYGHNMRDDTMFCMLHEFENKDFFDQNKYFYIYTPGRKLTYEIVSALKYDNRRITVAYDFSDPEQIESYQYSILNPKFDLFNSRNIALDVNSKIVTLSTCVANRPSYRYLVNGVLINDEPTR